MGNIRWNDRLQIIFADVDETVADLFVPADPEMIVQLEALLDEGKVIFFVTGAGIKSVHERVVSLIREDLRYKILVGHCSGVEVWGYAKDGSMNEAPHYSKYDGALSQDQKDKFREVMDQVSSEFQLEKFPPMPLVEFASIAHGKPLSILYDDRGPQITFEFVNAYDLTEELALEVGKSLGVEIPLTRGKYDLRVPVFNRSAELLQKNNVPITPRYGGEFALDHAVEGVSKTVAVEFVVNNPELLKSLDLPENLTENPELIEVWGDKFSEQSGTDQLISKGLPKSVRSITFRQEDSSEFPQGYDIQVWDGKEKLHNGLLEYLHGG